MLGAYLVNGAPCELLVEQETLSWWPLRPPPTAAGQSSPIKQQLRRLSNASASLFQINDLDTGVASDPQGARHDDHEHDPASGRPKRRLVQFDQIVGLRPVQSRGSIKRKKKQEKRKQTRSKSKEDGQQQSDSTEKRTTTCDETATTTNEQDAGDGRQFDRLKVYHVERNEKKSTGRLMKLKKLTIEALQGSVVAPGGNSRGSQVISSQDLERQQRLMRDVHDLIEQNLELKRRQRPRRLLVFVNPFGGKGKALQLYKSRVCKLLELGQVEHELQVTKYANHARDTLEDPLFNLDLFDGIVCIGGDGMFAELMNGLLFRFNRDKLLSSELDLLNRRLSESLSSTTSQSLGWSNGSDCSGRGLRWCGNGKREATGDRDTEQLDQQLRFLRSSLGGIGEQFQSPNIPIGVIGAGSTDANLFGFIGTNDAVSATLNILLGKQIQIDVCSIHSVRDDRLLRFVSTFVAYGYFGDVIRESEKLRWLGPSRYDVTALNSLIKYRNYRGLVRILRSRADGSPLDLRSRCHLNCRLCGQQGARRCATSNSASNGAENNKLQSANNNHISNSLSLDESLLRRATADCDPTTTSEKPAAGRPRTPSNDGDSFEIVEVEGAFVGVNAAVTACRCPQTRKGFSPGNHLANGCADLILVRPCSRMQYINYLIRTGYTRKSAFDLKYVDAYRCRQFEFIVEQPDDLLARDRERLSEPQASDDIATSDYQSKGSAKLSTNGTSIASSRQSSHANSLNSAKQSDSAAASYQSETPKHHSSNSKQLPPGRPSGAKDAPDKLNNHDTDEPDESSSWNADGEILREQSIRVKVNNKLLRVFGTGEPQPRPSKGHRRKASASRAEPNKKLS